LAPLPSPDRPPTPAPAAGADGHTIAIDGALLDYLCVDGFLKTLVDARALKTAFELKLVDRLQAASPAPVAIGSLVTDTGADPQGLRFLLQMLGANRVVVPHGDAVALHPAFVAALRYRALLEAKIDHSAFMVADLANLFSALVVNPARFTRFARVFQLFDPVRCLEATHDNHQHVRRWVRLTSALTHHEAPVCLALHDFSLHRRMLDVGGNSGEFALQACRRHAGLSAAVLDLPVVCDVGLAHVLDEPEAARIAFFKADLRHDDLPDGHDLISFKSMLHDWPAAQACAFLAKAAGAVEPGGTLLIFERGPLEVGEAVPGHSALPQLMSFRSYRSPDLYLQQLHALGMVDLRCLHLRLDTPFFLVTARRPAA
jgi:O-methyltransferase domain